MTIQYVSIFTFNAIVIVFFQGNGASSTRQGLSALYASTTRKCSCSSGEDEIEKSYACQQKECLNAEIESHLKECLNAWKIKKPCYADGGCKSKSKQQQRGCATVRSTGKEQSSESDINPFLWTCLDNWHPCDAQKPAPSTLVTSYNCYDDDVDEKVMKCDPIIVIEGEIKDSKLNISDYLKRCLEKWNPVRRSKHDPCCVKNRATDGEIALSCCYSDSALTAHSSYNCYDHEEDEGEGEYMPPIHQWQTLAYKEGPDLDVKDYLKKCLDTWNPCAVQRKSKLVFESGVTQPCGTSVPAYDCYDYTADCMEETPSTHQWQTPPGTKEVNSNININEYLWRCLEAWNPCSVKRCKPKPSTCTQSGVVSCSYSDTALPSYSCYDHNVSDTQQESPIHQWQKQADKEGNSDLDIDQYLWDCLETWNPPCKPKPGNCNNNCCGSECDSLKVEMYPQERRREASDPQATENERKPKEPKPKELKPKDPKPNEVLVKKG